MYNTEKSNQLKEKFKDLASTKNSVDELAATYVSGVTTFFKAVFAIALRSLAFYAAQYIICGKLALKHYSYLDVVILYAAYETMVFTFKENFRGWKQKD